MDNEVWFCDDRGLITCGEIISSFGPWHWITDGAGLHTVLQSECYERLEDVKPCPKPSIW